MTYASTYSVEPELSSFATRRARLAPGAVVGRYFMVAIILVVLSILGTLAYKDITELNALLAHGRTTNARIFGKREVRGKSTTYYLDYFFLVDGASQNGSETVSSAWYESVNEGDSLLVTYLPGHLETHRVGGVNAQRVKTSQTNWMVGIGAFMLLSWLVVCAIEGYFRGQLRLAERGIPVPGNILTCKAPSPTSKSKAYAITYEFVSPNGAAKRGSASIMEDRAKSLQAGMTVTVLCDPNESSRFALYLALDVVHLEGTAGFTMALETAKA